MNRAALSGLLRGAASAGSLELVWAVASRWTQPDWKLFRSGTFQASKLLRQEPELDWMTLDLHSPYEKRKLPDKTLTGSLQVYEALLASQLDLYSRMVTALPSYQFFIVGDHAPKFFDANDGQYQSRRVPFFVVPPCR